MAASNLAESPPTKKWASKSKPLAVSYGVANIYNLHHIVGKYEIGEFKKKVWFIYWNPASVMHLFIKFK